VAVAVALDVGGYIVDHRQIREPDHRPIRVLAFSGQVVAPDQLQFRVLGKRAQQKAVARVQPDRSPLWRRASRPPNQPTPRVRRKVS
jgi:hypothetical protein